MLITDNMFCWSTVLLLLVLAGVCSYLFLFHVNWKRSSAVASKNKLPPGPRGLPLLGCLHKLGHLPHLTLHRWANEYGPIMYVKLGLIPTVVVSSPHAAQQFLKTHDLVFASRPITEINRLVSYNLKGLSFSKYGGYWRNVRKLCTVELLSNLKVESFQPMRREEVGLLIGSLKEAAKAHVVVNLTTKLASLSKDMICRMVLGKKYLEENLGKEGFKAAIDEVVYLAGAFNVSEYIPCTRELDLQGIGRRMKAVSNAFDEFFEEIIDEHIAAAREETTRQRDFVDFMLSFMEFGDYDFPFDRNNVKAVMLDMLVAATDTTATALEWALSELIKHPPMMEKAQEEIETIVGKDRMVDESDLAKLGYLDMVVKESMRLHPLVPLLLPHESMEDCTVNGFHIPKGTRLFINAWAIGRDPDAWPNPDEFQPERFIGTDIDVRGHHYQLLPFGSGRRGCPGIQLGLTVVRLVLAQLIHCFDWELPHGMWPTDLDMTEKFGLVMTRANHLWATPTYRLRDVSS